MLADVRGEGRALRVTWHPVEDVLVVSIWRADVCVGSVRLDPAEAGELAAAVVGWLARRP